MARKINNAKWFAKHMHENSCRWSSNRMYSCEAVTMIVRKIFIIYIFSNEKKKNELSICILFWFNQVFRTFSFTEKGIAIQINGENSSREQTLCFCSKQKASYMKNECPWLPITWNVENNFLILACIHTTETEAIKSYIIIPASARARLAHDITTGRSPATTFLSQ